MEEVTFWQLISFGENGWGKLLLMGTGMTLALSCGGFLIGALIGTLGAWAKICGNRPVRYLADGYTTIIRGVPDLLIIYLLYFGGSSALTMLARLFGSNEFLGLPGFVAGVIAVGVSSGAQQTEVYRGAFYAVSKGEIEAAKACGMSTMLRLKRIIMPLLLRHAIPALGNVWQLVLKASALVSVTGVAELLTQSQTGAGSTGKPFDFFMAAAMLYLLISICSGWIMRRTEAHYSRGVKR
ncbi:ABC transporter permease [Brenneria goodwinii]|uniref:ABC transporter permease n=1 Tax=Brenneria goodwinii TaxID=1109412 RepID=A0A0G4JUJ5_9GAMM|nr:ABC transporter permease subunit [Brenneria goodwinii]ATA26351.1 ABC transporter permease [Brenneria goodwinii]MCG8158177.1 ABC transporter permease subunit [Brenneria goodwinii]MCG8162647.1 ABC transporter permease subunit [Brenneria goodwinii]MCG8167227.1 ABC transporter permease subunit [Brenneria goodwinii]MCG8171937.1 ABC transporter permease subunit [Brenneria goodwinii]